MSARRRLVQVYHRSYDAAHDLADLGRLTSTSWNGRPPIRSTFARVRNFGDRFNRDLVRHFGYTLLYAASPDRSQVSLTGSILGAVPEDATPLVLGSGFIHDRFRRTAPAWRIRMLRGPCTAERCGADPNDVLLADPGILAPLVFAPTPRPTHRLGVVPHYADLDTAVVRSLRAVPDVVVIDPRRSAAAVVEELTACAAVASSSLHGLVFADAYRIPNVHLVLGDRLEGGTFKFEDYALGMGRPSHEHLRVDRVAGDGRSVVDELVAECRLRDTDAAVAVLQERAARVLANGLAEAAAEGHGGGAAR